MVQRLHIDSAELLLLAGRLLSSALVLMAKRDRLVEVECDIPWTVCPISRLWLSFAKSHSGRSVLPTIGRSTCIGAAAADAESNTH